MACFHRRQPVSTEKSCTQPMGSCATAPPRAMPPMVNAGAQQQRSMCGKSSPPVRFTSDERKAMLAELTMLEDIRVRAVRDARCCATNMLRLMGLTARCGPKLFDAAEMPLKSGKIVHVVPRLDFSSLHGGAALRHTEVLQSTVAKEQAVAQVAAPAEASPEALKMQPHAKPVAAAIASLGPLAMQPPKQPAMRREFTFVV